MKEGGKRTLDEEKMNPMLEMPVLPLRGIMLFPGTVLHFDVGRAKSIVALEAAMKGDQQIFLVAQRDVENEDPEREDLYDVGTIARIKQIVRLPGENSRVLVEGVSRALLRGIKEKDGYMQGMLEPVLSEGTVVSIETDALLQTARDFFEDYCRASGRFPQELISSILSIQDPGQLADFIAHNVLGKLEERQEILDILDEVKRLETVCQKLLTETEMADVEKQVQARVRKQIEKNQKEYYLREQIKAIQTELGDRETTDTEALREQLEKTPMNDEARSRTLKEIEHLSRMAPGNPESSVSRNYVDWMLELPWGKLTEDNLDLDRARKVLAEDHCGLDEVKERVIEYLAVCKIKNNLRGPILCFVGPPGVGKTSVSKSIARALGRNFVQMSLGGLRDEAEIRGHRRTYIGAIPGRIISSMKQAGTMNPVFLFDEIDKLGTDVRGDPASAMLEVLDSAQNNMFRDHYLEAPFDLSQVMFITTANTVDTIPRPLLDRMEIIEISGYTEDEKVDIVKEHLLPDQIKEHGLPEKSVKLSDRVIREVIRGYTLEAGVRNLQRNVSKLVRKSAVEMIDQKEESVNITMSKLTDFLGAPRHFYEKAGKKPEVGVVNGLAWTAAGGDTLQIETSIMPGTGKLELTGSLGDVMKESAHAALTFVRAHAETLGIDPDFYKQKDIHIHVPEGAVPKDGPSAGVTMTTCLVSALTGIGVKQNVAMTGEVTLRGRVLPIGGLKEKMLAAHRAGIDTVVIPKENQRDLRKIPENVLADIHVVVADNVMTAIKTALVKMPAPQKEKPVELPKGSLDVKPGIFA